MSCHLLRHRTVQKFDALDVVLDQVDFVASVWKIYEDRRLDSARFVPYWRENVSGTKGVWCSRYLGEDGTATAVVSNLTSARRKAVLSLGDGYVRARDLLGGGEHEILGGRLEFDAESFRPYIFALEGL